MRWAISIESCPDGTFCPITPFLGSPTWVVCPCAKEVFGFCVDATALGIVDDGYGICYLFECLECNKKTTKTKITRSLGKMVGKPLGWGPLNNQPH